MTAADGLQPGTVILLSNNGKIRDNLRQATRVSMVWALDDKHLTVITATLGESNACSSTPTAASRGSRSRYAVYPLRRSINTNLSWQGTWNLTGSWISDCKRAAAVDDGVFPGASMHETKVSHAVEWQGGVLSNTVDTVDVALQSEVPLRTWM